MYSCPGSLVFSLLLYPLYVVCSMNGSGERRNLARGPHKRLGKRETKNMDQENVSFLFMHINRLHEDSLSKPLTSVASGSGTFEVHHAEGHLHDTGDGRAKEGDTETWPQSQCRGHECGARHCNERTGGHPKQYGLSSPCKRVGLMIWHILVVAPGRPRHGGAR